MRFEDVGPLQVIVVSFGPDAEFSGLIVEELDRLVASGTLRVIDLRFLTRAADGSVGELALDSLTEEERSGFGHVIDALRAAAGQPSGSDGESLGLGPADLEQHIADLPPGESIGIMLFEHTWATRLKAAVRSTGGRLEAQGLLTPEAALMIGEEVAAIADAEAVIELAAAVSGAAMLDAAATVAAAEDIKTLAAIDAVRALIAADIVRDTAATAALESLVEAQIVTAAAYDEAARQVLSIDNEADQAAQT